MKNITFRSPTLDDAHDMMEYINAISVEETFILRQARQISLEEEEKYLKDQLEKIKKGEVVAIHARINNQLVGVVDMSRDKDAASHVANMGLTVKKEYRGQGIGRALMNKIIAEAKNLPELTLLTLGVFAENEIAIKLYESLGFKPYGRLPSGIKRKGKYSDHLYYFLDVS